MASGFGGLLVTRGLRYITRQGLSSGFSVLGVRL